MKHTFYASQNFGAVYSSHDNGTGCGIVFSCRVWVEPVSTLCDGLYRTWNMPRGAASFLINGGIFCAFIFIDRHYINLGSVFVSFRVGRL